jgi:hypothetical protein
VKRLLSYLVDRLIARAKRTPYFHLPGHMERYWLLKPRWWTLGCSIRVHHILRSDSDRVLHDHPWPFMTVILRGGYLEERPLFKTPPELLMKRMALLGVEPTVTTMHRPGSVLFRAATSRHRLVIPRWKTAWTLFFMGPRLQEWGFYTPEGKVPWGDYLASADATYQREQIAVHRGAD